jgi:transcription elongation factor GreA
MRRDPEEAGSGINELMYDAASRPLAALSLIDMALEEPPEPFAPDPWLAALAAVLLVDGATKEPIRKQALGWLSMTGPLVERVRGREMRPGGPERWTIVLRRWRSSERLLKPVLDFLSDAGYQSLVEEVSNAQIARTERILRAGSDPSATDYTGHLMTRATYLKLLQERNRLVWELKNTIPAAIRKARELGDLRENAEYDAAKNKQADFAHRVGTLSAQLAGAKKIEELSPPPDEIAPGTEVLAIDTGSNQERTFWVLGEGDDWLGEDVISYATPLGRNFLGKKVGDRVSVVGSDAVHDFVIRSIQTRLPETEEKPEEYSVTEEDLAEISRIESGEGSES